MKKILSILLIITIFILGSFAVYAECINYTVTASRLNIRQSPNSHCRILGSVFKGTTFWGEKSINGWTPIWWNGERAYVWSAYIAPQPQNTTTSDYTQSDLDLLSRIVYAEAGSDWLSDEHQRAVASVVLNRVADSRFPNTISGVIYQKGQYGCVYNGMINRTPNQRAIDNAKYVLENGVTTPTNVVWQAQFKQGNGLWKNI